MLRLTGPGAQPDALDFETPLGSVQERNLGILELEEPAAVHLKLPSALRSPVIAAASAGELGACELQHLGTGSWFSLPIDRDAVASRDDLPAGLYQLYLLGQPHGQVFELFAGRSIERELR